MVGFSISNFRADLDTRGVMKTNHAQIVFSAPRGLQGEYSDTRAIGIRCESVPLPAVTFTTDDQHRRFGVGPIDKIPDQPLFDNLTTSFIADRRGYVHRFFYDWMSLISPFTTTIDNRFGASPYEATYRDDYVTDVFILVMDENNNQVLEYQLFNAHPVAVMEQQMGWGEQDQIVKVSVSFAYREWKQLSRDSQFYNTISSLITSADRILGGSNRIPISIIDDLRILF